MAEAATATLRFVSYLRPDVLGLVPRELVCDWPSEDGCRRVLDALDDHGHDLDEATAAAERDRIASEVREFASEALTVIQRELLPPGDALRFAYHGLGGGYQLIGVHDSVKVRVDARFNVAIIRQRPLAIDRAKPRLLTLRQELLDILSTPLASPDKKPIKARVLKDLDEVEPLAMYAEFDGPVGSGFANGRFESMRVYSDGKVTLLGFVPTRVGVNPFTVGGRYGTADESDPAFRVMADPDAISPAGSAGTGAPPLPGSREWTEEDQRRVDKNRAAAASAAADGGADAAAGGAKASGKAGKEGSAAADEATAGAAAAGEAADKGAKAKGAGGPGGARGGEAGGGSEDADGAAADRGAGAGGKGAAAGAGDDDDDRASAGAGAGAAAAAGALRLDEHGELQDDKIDVDAWNAGAFD